MDTTLSQILTYLYATLQNNIALEAENTALKAEVERLKPKAAA